jgi:Mrp family chromosome partitioning ATPase
VASTARIPALGRSARPTAQVAGHSLRTSGIEELKSALRRSALLIVGVVLLGIVGYDVMRIAAGPEYLAHARVVLSDSNLSSTVLGITPQYVDPSRQDQAEQNLVNSRELYSYAAARAGGRAGTGGQLRAAVVANANNNVIDFSAKTSDADRSKVLVTAVASAYPSWRARVTGQAIDAALIQVRGQITRFGKTPELESRLQQLQLYKNLTAGDTLFVEDATSATKTAPKPLMDSIVGAAIGLVIALLIVGGRELFDTTVRSESDVEDALDTPVLASIESLPRRLRDSVLDLKGGRFNDEYELLAARVAQIFDGHQGVVQLAVTSAVPGEGKTTTAANLAAALARRDANVLLADFDIRRPSVSQFMGIPRSAAGVNELLTNSIDVRSLLWRISPNGEESTAQNGGSAVAAPVPSRRRKMVATGAEGSLVVLPGGKASRSEATQPFVKLPSLLERLPDEVDYVVIDTPPALLVSGMAELAQSVDAVIVVVRHGMVHRRRLRALGRQARSWRARLIGAVLNDSPADDGYLNYYGRQ